MAVTASSIIQRVVDVVQDAGAVRWSTDELVRWLNDGLRELEIYRPDAYAVTESVALATGVRQTIPDTAIKLIEIPNNTGGGPVTQIDRSELDAVLPGWRTLASVAAIKHFMHDERAPRQFDVYPPATAGAAVDMTFAKYPTPIAQPGAGKFYGDVMGSIGVPDVFANALVDYVLYRAYVKDADSAGNASRAAAHYQQFASALGIEINSALLVGPGQPGSATGSGS